jgi:hypothetical protein
MPYLFFFGVRATYQSVLALAKPVSTYKANIPFHYVYRGKDLGAQGKAACNMELVSLRSLVASSVFHLCSLR